MCGSTSSPMAKNLCGRFKNKTQFFLFLALILVASASFLLVFLSFSVTFDGSKDSLPLNRRTLVQIPSRNGANNVKNLHQDVHQTATFAAATNTINDREFQMAAHEVPSGPNPESN